ncbi:MAG: hypothetical protein NVS2B16_05460 [Chloroflexota bacterium]
MKSLLGAKKCEDPGSHLRGGSSRKCDREYLIRSGAARSDLGRNPVSDHASFAAPGSGNNQQGTVLMHDHFTLFSSQRGIQIGP